MFNIIISCLVGCYLYYKTYTLEHKISYLEYELYMMGKNIYDNPSSSVLLLK